MNKKTLVGIVIGSDSDLDTIKETAKILDKFNVGYRIDIISAHRSPKKLYNYALNVKEKGLEVIIAGAGMSAHLPGVLASLVTIPVIGVPMETNLGGLDSLLSMVQMPSGVAVATVSIGKAGAKNAGILACEILALKYKDIEKKIDEYKKELEEEIEKKNKKLKDEYNF